MTTTTTPDVPASNPSRHSSRTGVKGVWRTKSGSYACRVKLDGRDLHLGCFATIAKAQAHREDAVAKLRRPTTVQAINAVLREGKQ